VSEVSIFQLSIIIPTLNEEEGIVEFLQPLQQLRADCELLIVDGGSDDYTVELAQPYVDDVLKSAKGRAMQMNEGAAIASAPVLLFLHADTSLPDDALTQIQSAIDRGANWGRFDVTLSTNDLRLNIVAWMMNKRSYLTGIATGDQAIFVKKDLFEELGGFANIALMEDIELSSRLKKQGRPYCVKSKVISSARRWLSFGVIRTILLMWFLRLRYFFGADPIELEQLYRKGRFWKA